MRGLQKLAVTGGLFLATRQLAGMGISLVGLILVTRLLGPARYGAYAVAFGITNYVFLLSQWGLNVFLVRTETVSEADWHQALTLLLGAGLTEALAVPLIAPLVETWLGIAHLSRPLMALAACLPLQLMALVPAARLERELRYRPLAICELAGQACLYLVAVPCAWAGLGVAAPVAGQWAQQLVTATALFAVCRLRPRLVFDRDRVRRMLTYGLAYSSSIWVWQLRLLVNPLVVAPALGAEAAAVVNVATRLVESAGFLRNVTWRIFIPLLARLQQDRSAMAAAVSHGLRLQVLGIGILLVGFAVVAPTVVPRLFGHDWRTILDVYPFLATGFLFNCLFNLEASALYVLARNWQVTWFHLAHVALFAGTAILLTPRFGLPGYGCGELAALAAYALVHRWCRQALGTIHLGLGLAWASGFATALFASPGRPWPWLGLGLVVVLPETWQQLAAYWSRMKELPHAG